MLYLIAVFVCVIAYVLGSLSSSVIISKKISGKDIRNEGSGNAGATNMLRVHGKKAGILTLLCDALKGIVAVLIGTLADEVILSELAAESSVLVGNLKYIAAIAVVLGHDFPVFFGFKGGKGVATSLGVMLILDWKIGLIVAVAALFVMAISRYVSLGSIVGGVIYPVAVIVFMIGKSDINWVYFLSAVVLGVMVVAKHRSNIKRLISGNENKLFSKNKKGGKA